MSKEKTEKKNAVIILGAGASAPFGVPTLANVFKDQQARQQLKKDAFLNEKLNQLFWQPRGQTLETSNQSVTVEEILTLANDFERPFCDEPLPDLLGTDKEKFKRSLYVLIKKAVYDSKTSNGKYLNPLIDFSSERYSSILWASFNWDCIFESSFYYNSASPGNYRSNPKIVLKDLVGWKNSASNHTFIKLHGGINWWFENKQLHYLPFGGSTLNDKWNEYENNKTLGNPVILEPSFYKYEDPLLEILKPQWKAFLKGLLEADEIIIVGYSLPALDIDSRKALTIALQANMKAKICVIDKSDDMRSRYERLFGTNRLRCITRDLSDISKELPAMLVENLK